MNQNQQTFGGHPDLKSGMALITVAGQHWIFTKLSPLPPMAAHHRNRLII
jgi:hypothetical protein